jgi:hypothetical protein
VLEVASIYLGLSILRNFDNTHKPLSDSVGSDPDTLVNGEVGRRRYGAHGITRYGARIVRNAAHLIEREGGRARTVFATATAPNLPIEQMARLHERWHKAVELYRLGLRRMLQAEGLSGESVTVSEIQEKRYERTGIPVLHIHTVFINKDARGRWVITPEDHDRLWLNAVTATIGIDHLDVSASCSLERVKHSTEGYIGKYMSKGAKVVESMVQAGFDGWLPKQWWNCSRALRARIDQKTRAPHALAGWLYDAADRKGADIWLWHRDVEIEFDGLQTIVIARYGRLTARTMHQLEAFDST